jgi:hypothetical protein
MRRRVQGVTAKTSHVVVPTSQYIPAQGEPVIGVVIARHMEGYRVDIGSSQSASLDALAFEDATKRNKPDLKVIPNFLEYVHAPAEPFYDLNRLARSSMLEYRWRFRSVNLKSNASTQRLGNLKGLEN